MGGRRTRTTCWIARSRSFKPHPRRRAGARCRASACLPNFLPNRDSAPRQHPRRLARIRAGNQAAKGSETVWLIRRARKVIQSAHLTASESPCSRQFSPSLNFQAAWGKLAHRFGDNWRRVGVNWRSEAYPKSLYKQVKSGYPLGQTGVVFLLQLAFSTRVDMAPVVPKLTKPSRRIHRRRYHDR